VALPGRGGRAPPELRGRAAAGGGAGARGRAARWPVEGPERGGAVAGGRDAVAGGVRWKRTRFPTERLGKRTTRGFTPELGARSTRRHISWRLEMGPNLYYYIRP
jgi:hypothetical protein